jgi:hypothetical protein
MWRASAKIESRSPAWRQISLASAIELARHEGNATALAQALDEAVQLPGGNFIPSDVEVTLLIGEALLDAGRLDDLGGFLTSRRLGIERFRSLPGLAALAMLDARLAARAGELDRADRLLAQAVRWGDEAEDAPRRWRARELRVEVLGQQDDRASLREFLMETAERLPESLRAQFFSNRRVAARLN